MFSENMYSVKQESIRTVDKILSGLCIPIIAVVIPAIYGIYGKINDSGILWINAAIILVIPTLFTLLWHLARWPVRLHAMRQSLKDTVEIFSRDMLKIVDDIAVPQINSVIFGTMGEKIIEGPDGKEYLTGRKEDIENKMIEKLVSVLHPDNFFVANTIDAHVQKINDAQRRALVGLLDERFARIKQIIDFISRKTRHLFFLLMVISVIIGLMQMK